MRIAQRAGVEFGGEHPGFAGKEIGGVGEIEAEIRRAGVGQPVGA